METTSVGGFNVASWTQAVSRVITVSSHPDRWFAVRHNFNLFPGTVMLKVSTVSLKGLLSKIKKRGNWVWQHEITLQISAEETRLSCIDTQTARNRNILTQRNSSLYAFPLKKQIQQGKKIKGLKTAIDNWCSYNYKRLRWKVPAKNRKSLKKFTGAAIMTACTKYLVLIDLQLKENTNFVDSKVGHQCCLIVY